MRSIRSTNTAPEILIRRVLWRKGLRYRLHQRVDGAKPDLIFSKARVAIFVDGCFWHGCPKHYKAPAGNHAYWVEKLRLNQERDRRDQLKLTEAGWTVLRFWECAIKAGAENVACTIDEAVRAGSAR